LEVISSVLGRVNLNGTGYNEFYSRAVGFKNLFRLVLIIKHCVSIGETFNIIGGVVGMGGVLFAQVLIPTGSKRKNMPCFHFVLCSMV